MKERVEPMEEEMSRIRWTVISALNVYLMLCLFITPLPTTSSHDHVCCTVLQAKHLIFIIIFFFLFKYLFLFILLSQSQLPLVSLFFNALPCKMVRTQDDVYLGNHQSKFRISSLKFMLPSFISYLCIFTSKKIQRKYNFF